MYLTIWEIECRCGCVWVDRLGPDDTPYSLDVTCPDCGGDLVTAVEVART